MVVYRKKLGFKTKVGSIIDITSDVESVVRESKIKNGLVCIFVPGSTGAVTTMEYESGLISDFWRTVERVCPSNIEYRHNLRWGDGNGHSHIRASFLGPSLTVPIENGTLDLGTWQQIVFIELDNRNREREITVQIVGD